MTVLATTETVGVRPQGGARHFKLDPYKAFLSGLIAEEGNIALTVRPDNQSLMAAAFQTAAR